MDVFEYIPSTGFSLESTPKVLSSNFGDNYSQRVGDGINNIGEEWDLTFTNRKLEDADAIISFFTQKRGTEAFLWTPPGETEQVVVLASSWKKSYSSPATRTISVKFTRTYET